MDQASHGAKSTLDPCASFIQRLRECLLFQVFIKRLGRCLLLRATIQGWWLKLLLQAWSKGQELVLLLGSHIKAKSIPFVHFYSWIFCAIDTEFRTLLTIATWESSFRELTLFTSSPLPRLEPPLNYSFFHLSIASKSLQTCLPLFHASSIICAALGASCIHQAPSIVLNVFNI